MVNFTYLAIFDLVNWWVSVGTWLVLLGRQGYITLTPTKVKTLLFSHKGWWAEAMDHSFVMGSNLFTEYSYSVTEYSHLVTEYSYSVTEYRHLVFCLSHSVTECRHLVSWHSYSDTESTARSPSTCARSPSTAILSLNELARSLNGNWLVLVGYSVTEWLSITI